MLQIEELRDRKLVIITVSGFWDRVAAEAYRTRIRHIAAEMRLSGPWFDTLICIDQQNLLGQDAVPVIEQSIVEQHAQGLRRTAFVTPFVLTGLQAKRLVQGNSSARVFSDRASAMKWLDSEDPE